MLIVVSMVMVICSMGIPILLDQDRLMLEHELEKIEVIMHTLQQRAMLTQQPQVLLLNQAHNSFAYDGKKPYTLDRHLMFGVNPSVYGPPGNPTGPITQVITFPVMGDGYGIKIFPNGNISAGTLYMCNKKRTMMGALTCTVSQVSYIRRYVYRSGHWFLLAS
jgi:hypothetical protein